MYLITYFSVAIISSDIKTYMTILKNIVVNPRIHFGKPCIAGTRIPVQNVLELIREGIPFDLIIRDYYNDLTREDIRACVEYAIAVVQSEEISFHTLAA